MGVLRCREEQRPGPFMATLQPQSGTECGILTAKGGACSSTCRGTRG